MPEELSRLRNSSVASLCSTNGPLQHIEVFVHIYVAGLLLLVNDTRMTAHDHHKHVGDAAW